MPAPVRPFGLAALLARGQGLSASVALAPHRGIGRFNGAGFTRVVERVNKIIFQRTPRQDPLPFTRIIR